MKAGSGRNGEEGMDSYYEKVSFSQRRKGANIDIAACGRRHSGEQF
jgi:hypothetical protein